MEFDWQKLKKARKLNSRSDIGAANKNAWVFDLTWDHGKFNWELNENLIDMKIRQPDSPGFETCKQIARTLL